MPELPEVETIKRELKPKIINQKITDCHIFRKEMIAYPSAKHFCRSIVDEEIIDVTRRAKYLILELTNSKTMIFHLRLSGAIFLRDLRADPERFTRVVITLEKNKLFFNEPRVLGRIHLLEGEDHPCVPKGLLKLGYEPISPEFDFRYLISKIKSRKAPIKSLLLDQRVCAGVGNIYSDEALFHAGIRPQRRANRITSEEIFRLLTSLKDVLNKAVDNFGTSVSDYARPDGRNGNFQQHLYVYGREDKPCRVCGAKIVVTKIGGRNTRYCPKCQK